MLSLTYQAGNRFESKPPPGLLAAIDSVVQLYPTSRNPSWASGLEVDVNELLVEIEHHMNYSVVRDSTPGIPYKLLGQTNQIVMEDHGPFLARVIVCRLLKMASVTKNHLKTLSAMQLCEQGYCDPVRVFVKNEPHTKLKMSQGRYRIISSVSLADGILQRCVLQNQDEVEITKWTQHPSQPGIGFTDEMTKRFLAQIPSGDIAEADVTGWDWSVQGWEFAAEALMRVKLVRNCSKLFARLTENLLYIQSFSVFSLSDGNLYEQLSPGIMKSGAKNTSSSNSRIRVLAHHLLNPIDPWVVAMGDDSLEKFFEGASDAATTQGSTGFRRW